MSMSSMSISQNMMIEGNLIQSQGTIEFVVHNGTPPVIGLLEHKKNNNNKKIKKINKKKNNNNKKKK